jgi:hypothetical protein
MYTEITFKSGAQTTVKGNVTIVVLLGEYGCRWSADPGDDAERWLGYLDPSEVASLVHLDDTVQAVKDALTAKALRS